MDLGDVVLAVGLLAAIAMAFEVAARLAAEVPFWPPTNFLASRSAMLRNNTALRFDPEIGWALREGFHVGGLQVIDHGIRIVPDVMPRSLNDGVVVVGGSFVLGAGVWAHEAWPTVLEQKLAEAGEDACVLNAGCGGWAVDQIVLRAERLCRELRPHTVILAFAPTNIEDVALTTYAGMAKPFFDPVPGSAATDDEPVLRNVPTPRSLVPLRELPLPQRILGFSYLALWLAEQFRLPGWEAKPATFRRTCDHGDLGRRILRRFERFARAQGIRTLYVLQYGASNVIGRNEKPYAWITRFVEGLRADGLDVVDTWPWIHGDYRRGGVLALQRWFQIIDGGFDHPSIDGNRWTAEIVARHMTAGSSGNPAAGVLGAPASLELT